MLHPEYIKDMKNSYLLLKSMEVSTLGYGSKMLIYNRIPGLLKVEIRCFDELNVYYYDISNKKNLLDYYDKKSLNFDDIKHILTCVISGLEGSLEYLLSENDFVLEPGYVYVDLITNEVLLCHLVGYQVNVQTQISSLIEYLMNKVDYKDERAVLLVYSLYKESREPNCTYVKLLSELNKISDDKELKTHYRESNIYNKESNTYNKESKTYNAELKTYNTESKEVKTENGELNKLNSNPLKRTKKVVTKVETGNNKVKKGIELKSIVFKKVKDKITTDSGYKPLLQETIGEEETMCYSHKTYMIAIIFIVLGVILFIIAFALKLMHNTFKTELDPIKVFCYFLIIVSIEMYVLFRLFHDSNKITKIVSTIKYEKDNINENDNINEKNNIYEKDNIYENESMSLDKKEESNIIYYNDMDRTGDNELTVNLYEAKETEDMVSDVTEALAYFEPKLLLKPLDKDNYKYINLSKFPFLVGKSQKAVNHCFNSNTVSRIHSRFEKKGDEIYLVDLNSLNGTYINGERLVENQPCIISSGDKISFAHLNYIYQVE